MKQCPNCRTTYTDDSLQFCLQDGTPLVFLQNAEQPTGAWNEPETVVRSRFEQSSGAQVVPAAKKSNTLLVVFLTALVTLLVFAGGVGAWLFLRNGGGEAAVNSKKDNANIALPSASPNVSPKTSPTPTPTPTAAPTPEINAGQIRREVSERIADWNSAQQAGDINALMSNYAERLDYYYNSRGVSAEKIRADKQRAFSLYDELRFKISEMRITPDPSGEKAIAVFDKEWEFEGENKYSAGKVQSQMQLIKIGGKWLITGERDLKVYYTE